MYARRSPGRLRPRLGHFRPTPQARLAGRTRSETSKPTEPASPWTTGSKRTHPPTHQEERLFDNPWIYIGFSFDRSLAHRLLHTESSKRVQALRRPDLERQR